MTTEDFGLPKGEHLNTILIKEVDDLMEQQSEVTTMEITMGGQKRSKASIAIQKLHRELCLQKKEELALSKLDFIQKYSKPAWLYFANEKKKRKQRKDHFVRVNTKTKKDNTIWRFSHRYTLNVIQKRHSKITILENPICFFRRRNLRLTKYRNAESNL